MDNNKEYFAFISYQRQDEEWAKWLAHELEHYHFPITLNGRMNLPKELRPIFRDIDELSAGNLPKQIHRALSGSKHLIVICSPNSAKSPWVNKEIEEFISMGKTDKIFPFIIDGKPFSSEEGEECFPLALRNLPKEDERLGGNINEMGRDAAVVKIVAGMLDLEFDTLWQRYEREKAEEERRKSEERNNLLKVQSRYLSEVAIDVFDNGDSITARLLALEALPVDLENPNRPYVAEAEKALRYSMKFDDYLLREGHNDSIYKIIYSPDGNYLLSTAIQENPILWNLKTGGKNVLEGFLHYDIPTDMAFSSDGKLFAISGSHYVYIYKLENCCCIKIKTIKKNRCEHSFLHFLNDKYLLHIDHKFGYISVNWFLLYDISTGSIVHKFKHDDNSTIRSFAINHKNDTVVTTSESGKTYFWDMVSNSQLKIWGDKGLAIEFSPDDKCIAFENKGHVDIWNIEKETLSESFVFPNNTIIIGSIFNNIVWLRDNESISSYDKNKASFTYIYNPGFHINCSIIHPNGYFIAIAGHNNSIIIHDISKKYQELDTHCSSIQISQDGKFFILFENDIIKVFDSKSKSLQYKYKKENNYFFENISGTFNSDDAHITSVHKNCINIYDIATKKIVRRITGSLEEYSHIHFVIESDDSSSILYGPILEHTENKWCVKVFKTKTRTTNKIYAFRGQDYSKMAIFSLKANVIALMAESAVEIWDTDNTSLISRLEGHKLPISFLDFSPDGEKIVTASEDSLIKIWNIKSGVTEKTLKGHKLSVISVQYSPSGNYIASASTDGFVYVWDVSSGTIIHTIKTPYNDHPRYATFINDEQELFVIFNNFKIVTFPFLPLGDIIMRARHSTVGHSLTEEDRNKYYIPKHD